MMKRHKLLPLLILTTTALSGCFDPNIDRQERTWLYFWNLAQLKLQDSDTKGARACLEQCRAQSEPVRAGLTLEGLAEIDLAEQKWSDGVTHSEAAIKQFSTAGDIALDDIVACYGTQARALIGAGRMAEAARILKLAIARSSCTIDMHTADQRMQALTLANLYRELLQLQEETHSPEAKQTRDRLAVLLEEKNLSPHLVALASVHSLSISETDNRIIDNDSAGTVPLLVDAKHELHRLGQPQKANAILQKAIVKLESTCDKNSLRAAALYYEQAIACGHLNQLEDACDNFGKSAKTFKDLGVRNKQYIRSLQGLCSMQQRLNRLDDCEHTLKQLIEVLQSDSKEHDQAVNARATLGLILVQAKKYDEASVVLTEVLKDPEQLQQRTLAETYRALGLALISQNKPTPALEVLNKSAALWKAMGEQDAFCNDLLKVARKRAGKLSRTRQR